MRRASSTLPASDHDGQHQSDGRDFYNPAQNDYNAKFNEIAKAENDQSFNDIIDANYGDGRPKGQKTDSHGDTIQSNYNADPTSNIAALKDKEEQGSTTPASAATSQKTTKQTTPTTKKNRAWGTVSLKGKTSIIAVVLMLTGGGAFVSVMMSPSLILVQMKEILSQGLDDQFRSINKRELMLLRAKFSSGSCSTGIACTETTMSDKQVEDFKNAGTDVERTDIKDGRGKVKSITAVDPDTGAKSVATTAAEFDNLVKNNVSFRASLLKVFNPTFVGSTDATALKVLRAAGIKKEPQLAGSTDEEREKSLNNAVVNGDENSDTNSLHEQTDKNGKPTGEYVDSNGNTFSSSEVANANTIADQSSKLSSISSGELMSSVGNVLKVDGVLDGACSVYNGAVKVGNMRKAIVALQLMRFAIGGVLSTADDIKSGNADGGQVETIGNMMTQSDTRQTVVDQSKINDPGSAANPPTVTNPDYNKSAMDSPGMKLAQYGDVPTLDTRASRFSLGWSLIGSLSSVTTLLAKTLGTTPKGIQQKCHYVQNPFVRVGAFGLGILASAGSFGVWDAAMAAGTLAVGIAMPYILTQAADIMAGKIATNLTGMDFGDAAFTGTSAYFGDVAQHSGLKPLSAQEAADYTNATQQDYAQYGDAERYLARSTPFDINNRFSFLGSITRSLMPLAYSTQSTAGTMSMQLASFVPAALLGQTTAHATDSSVTRFQQCTDPFYKDMHIGADVFCNVRYGLSDAELSTNISANDDWMANTGNIDAHDPNGDPKDNGQDWNYEKWLAQCPNRTSGWGDSEDDTQGDGENCLSSQNEAANEHFRVYLLDHRLSDDMDNTGNQSNLPGTTGVGTGQTGTVSPSGWAYPTTQDATQIQGYDDPAHQGVDLANKAGAPIFAAADGTVVASGPAQGLGNRIVIESTINGKTYSTIYGHMADDGVLVQQGQSVKAGQEIGTVGSNQSSEPELYFGLWDGSFSNPSCIRNGKPETSDCSLNPSDILTQAKQISTGVAL